jgi:flagellar motor switch/type III secretory pathway protein FliN
MKTSEKTITAAGDAEEPFATGDLSLDPFAVDIFGKETVVENEQAPAAVEAAPAVDLRVSRPKRAAWFAALPRVARREAEFSNSFLELPDNLLSASAAKKIEETIAYYTLRSPHDVKCAVISVAEVNLTETIQEAAKAPHVFLNLGCQPDNSRALIAINADFAASIINSVLIDDGTTVFAVRELSAIERTIIEFLGINILGEVNNLLGRTLFCLQTVETEASAPFGANERGAEILVALNFGSFSGALSLFVSHRFLSSLGAATRGTPAEKSSNKNVLETLERFVPKLNLHALIGTTRLSGADLNYLEPDDIIIIDQPEIEWQSAAFQGNLRVYLGAGRNFRLDGNIVEDESDAELKLKIEEIAVGEERGAATAAIRMQMNETQNNLADFEAGEMASTETFEPAAGENAEENPAALENVLVTLRVELGAGKVSLREMQNLRAGQIISLGARPTDPVRIVTDAGEQPVATGELIEIEGQLGVRLTKIFI